MALTHKFDKILDRRGFWVICLFAAGAAGTHSAFAAQPRIAVQQDVYPATESETSPGVAASAPVPAARPKQAAGIAMPHPSAASRLTSKLPDSALAYDLVPSDQIDPIGKRLQVVEILIRKYSRAYDYRTHTVRELDAILAKLDAASMPQRAQAPAATKQVAKAGPAPLPIPSEDDEAAGGETPRKTDD